jgi:ribonuclease P protein component
MIDIRIERLKKRPDFLKVTKQGSKFVAPSFVLLARKRNKKENIDEDVVRLGFTVSKKVGNAIARNRVRRRLKEATRQTFSDNVMNGCDYVVIGRKRAIDISYDSMVADMIKGLSYLSKKLESK